MEKSKMPNKKFQLKKKNKVKGDYIKTQNESCTTRMKTMNEEFITKKRDKVCILNQLHGYMYPTFKNSKFNQGIFSFTYIVSLKILF